MDNSTVQTNTTESIPAPVTGTIDEPQSEATVDTALDAVPLLERASITDGLYSLVMLGAALMRFVNLGAIPLSPVEAAQAFAVWQHTQPNQAAAVIGSPAYFSLTSILITLLGSNDMIMRLVPAIFGLGIVMLPWFLRDRLGSIGTLVAASFLAVSPLLAVSSRTVGGESIALFALLLIVVAGLKRGKDDRVIWHYVLAVALGLGLASAPLIYSGLLTLLIARWTQQRIAPDQSAATRLERADLIKVAAVGLVVLIALSTRFFTFPAGIGATAQLLGEWLGQFQLLGDIPALIAPFSALARYEIVLLALGIMAMLWAIWRNQALGILLTYWLIAILMLMLVQRGVLANILIAPLACYLLLGLVSNHLLRHGFARWSWAVTGVTLFLGALVLVNLTRFLRVSFANNQQLLSIWLALITVALAALAVIFFWTYYDKAIVQGSWFGIIILLLLFQWGTAWHLTQKSANDTRERWVQQATDDELPVLLATLEEISQSATNSDKDLELYSAVDSPVLHWYLRDFRQTHIGQTLLPGSQYEVIISQADVDQPVFGSDYFGSDFGLLRPGTAPEQLSSSTISDTLRWWLFHESTAPIIEERIILWVRSDLAYAE